MPNSAKLRRRRANESDDDDYEGELVLDEAGTGNAIKDANSTRLNFAFLTDQRDLIERLRARNRASTRRYELLMAALNALVGLGYARDSLVVCAIWIEIPGSSRIFRYLYQAIVNFMGFQSVFTLLASAVLLISAALRLKPTDTAHAESGLCIAATVISAVLNIYTAFYDTHHVDIYHTLMFCWLPALLVLAAHWLLPQLTAGVDGDIAGLAEHTYRCKTV